MQKVRMAEKERVFEEFKDRAGEIVTDAVDQVLQGRDIGIQSDAYRLVLAWNAGTGKRDIKAGRSSAAEIKRRDGVGRRDAGLRVDAVVEGRRWPRGFQNRWRCRRQAQLRHAYRRALGRNGAADLREDSGSLGCPGAGIALTGHESKIIQDPLSDVRLRSQ